MGIPIVSIPEQGSIATRPRRQPIYDTEADNNATAIPSRLTIFRSATAFQVANIGTTKTKGIDTNLDAPGGQLSKGDYHHWYSLTLPVGVRNINLTTAANAVQFEEILRVKAARWFKFRFSETPYIYAQLAEIPAGTGIDYVQTTHDAVTVYAVKQGRLARENRYDVTLDGLPVEITDQETFAADLESDSSLQPSPTNELFWTCFLWGTLLKGIRG